MTHAFNTPAVAKEAPRNLSVTELRSMTAVVLDDARVGHVTYIERGGRAVAAIVPVSVGQAYEAGADARRAVRDEIAGDVEAAANRITTTLIDLLDKVADPARRQDALDRLASRFLTGVARPLPEGAATDDGLGDGSRDPEVPDRDESS